MERLRWTEPSPQGTQWSGKATRSELHTTQGEEETDVWPVSLSPVLFVIYQDQLIALAMKVEELAI